MYVKDLPVAAHATQIDTSVTQPNSIILDISTTFNPDSFCVTSIVGDSFFTLLNCDSVLFLPDSSFVGTDTCYYILCDNSSTSCDTGIIIVTVLADSALYPIADFTFECGGSYTYSFTLNNASVNYTTGSARWIVYDDNGCDSTTLFFGDTVAGYAEDRCDGITTTPKTCLVVSNEFGSDSVCKVMCYFIWEGIEEVQPALVHIYPNPVKEQAMIIADDRAIGGTIQVTDVTGKEITSVKVQSKNQPFDTNKFSSGLYFARFVSIKGTMMTFKLFIE